MENLIIYIAKASALTGLFFLAYQLLLKKETFFTGNRYFLLAGLFTSAVLPLVTFKKIIKSETVTAVTKEIIPTNVLHQLPNVAAQPETFNMSWIDVTGGVYLGGFLLFYCLFIFNLISIRKTLKGNTIVKHGRFRLVDTVKVQSPFSFFNYIVYNSALLKPEELNGIIEHEKVHSVQKHSLDMIFTQLFCVVFWFNPLAWLYRKSISQNLEFIADAEAIKVLDDKKAYQKTLLKITVQPECIAITNHFYQSLIKKRIIMLNKTASRKSNVIKYSVVLPALAAFTFFFQVKTFAQKTANVAPENIVESSNSYTPEHTQNLAPAAPINTTPEAAAPAANAFRIDLYDMYGKQWYAENRSDSHEKVKVVINGVEQKGKPEIAADDEIASVKVLKSARLLEITTKKSTQSEAAKMYPISIDTMPDLTFVSLNKYSVQQLETLVTGDWTELK